MSSPRGLYAYASLDAAGEAEQAARRMEARAERPASAAMFAALVLPLLRPGQVVVEVGCGSGGLARRIVAAHDDLEVWATDKSAGMLAFARRAAADAPARLRFSQWEAGTPWPAELPARADLVVSAVTTPYLDEPALRRLLAELRQRTCPGGHVLFLEQDLASATVAHPDPNLAERISSEHVRVKRPWQGLGLRRYVREAGFSLLPRQSFLWTDERFSPYLRDLMTRYADDAVLDGLPPAEAARFIAGLEALDAEGECYYGMVYHRVLARVPDETAG
ncbi:methyltransferase domain-containing protein [Nannocystis pusilla]|uniref:Methyltransferase domain-containing protein n=1 Tax=Nannocystis pusilla TaxID=889268 RepID=A0ABS7TPI5_9BACT|nr:methyltransferase domain-containing protein [Nannocystis pusilla]MBZ5710057.1 methyltransferase domain-containing protein [Nannocystis pusilla]